MMKRKVKAKPDTRSVPIPDKLWDTADRYGRVMGGGIPRAAVVRQAMQEFFERKGVLIVSNDDMKGAAP